jgi:hypothetical protein
LTIPKSYSGSSHLSVRDEVTFLKIQEISICAILGIPIFTGFSDGGEKDGL